MIGEAIPLVNHGVIEAFLWLLLFGFVGTFLFEVVRQYGSDD